MSTSIPGFIADRIRQPAAFDCISAGSTPVPFFGNIENARVATLSLNPSHDEFYKRDQLRLVRGDKRLESLASLNASALEHLDEEQVRTIYDSCVRYYEADRKPYWRWFKRMENLLSESIGVRYSDGTCCHTDIIQWATNPKWSTLHKQSPAVVRDMLQSDLPFLKKLLEHYQINLIVMNGATAVQQFRELFSETLSEEQAYHPGGGEKGLKIFTGTVDLNGRRARYFGWNKYIHQPFSTTERAMLVEALRGFGQKALSAS